MAGTAGTVPATMPGPFLGGRAPGKTALLYHSSDRSQDKGCRFSDSRTAASIFRRHLAATELTVMVSPFRVPVTVAFLPACLSSVARAVLSVVSRI
jgi:hypothetical protein